MSGLYVLNTEVEFRRYWEASTGQLGVTAP